MIINNVQFNCELYEILDELQTQLKLNDIPLIQKTIDTNNDIMVQCPYHGNGQERRPSAGIRKTDGLFHCFACGETHSLQEVISHCFGHYDDVFGSFGWKWLNKNFATVEVEERKDVEVDLARRNISGKSSVLDNRNNISIPLVTEEELDSYRYTHPYMYERGLTDEIIDLFDIGYDRRTQCITFPVRDIKGNCLFVARRSVNTKYFNYPAGAEKPLYGLYELTQRCYINVGQMGGRSFPDIIVCESMLDALTAWVYCKPAVALNGLGNELQFSQLRDLPCRKLILATDNDKAGLQARERIRKNVKNKIITEYKFPEGVKDLNDLREEGFDRLVEVF